MIVDQSGALILEDDECMDLLATAAIGRVAVSIGAVPAVFPVNFSLLGGSVVFRTASGTKLAAATRHAVVAFEVDSFDPLYHEGWSVMVVGMAEELREGRALEAARALALDAWAPGEHSHYVCITPEFVSGRRISPAEAVGQH